MMAKPLVSIIINNYNYGRFLGEAIESALAQNYERIEVIVVDDGSEDCSREVIAAFGERIIPILKANGGQASAFNAGFIACRGDVVLFLDADDVLLPSVAERSVLALDEAGVVKAHWPLDVIDENGARTEDVRPLGRLPNGSIRDIVVRHGPNSHAFSPTSGNAWSRTYLESVLPMPESAFRISADTYLCDLAAISGTLRRIDDSLTLYRVHTNNHYALLSRWEKIVWSIDRLDDRCEALAKRCADLEIAANEGDWKENSWMWQLREDLTEIDQALPRGANFILVDQDQFGLGGPLAGRRCIPFLERDGAYWGVPPDDLTAIQELERLRSEGAQFIVFVRPALWWLDHYKELRTYLYDRYHAVAASGRMVILDIRAKARANDIARASNCQDAGTLAGPASDDGTRATFPQEMCGTYGQKR